MAEKVGEKVIVQQDELEKIFGTIASKEIGKLNEKIATMEAVGARVEAERVEAEKKNKEEIEKVKASIRADGYDNLMDSARSAKNKGEPGPDPMDLFGKFCVAGYAAVNDTPNTRNLDPQMHLAKAKKLYPDDVLLHKIMEKELTRKDLEASIPSAGGYGIPQILSPDIVRVLYANTILDKVKAIKTPMPNGNFRMVRMDTASTVGWVGEDTANAPTEPVLGDINLNAKKLFAMVPVSNSLLRYNAIGLDSWVSQDLAMKARIALDAATFYGTGSDYQPKGLTNQGIATSGSSTTSFAVTTPQTMVGTLENANVPMISPMWCLNPLGANFIESVAFSTGPFAWALEMSQNKTLYGIPYIKSASVLDYSTHSYADFFLGDFSEFIWGVGYDLSLEISREGTYVSGGTTYSAFQRDVTLIRLIAEHDFGVKHPVSFIQGTYKLS